MTGGATGLGEMAAQGFVQNGARVIIASRKASELEKTANRLNALGPGTCEWVVADLKDKAGCESLVSQVKKKTDRLTVLLNNSGATWGAAYDDCLFLPTNPLCPPITRADIGAQSLSLAGTNSWL